MSDLNGVVGYARRWIELHRENKFQREAAKIMQRVVDALVSVRAERDAALARIAEAAKLHRRATTPSGRAVCDYCLDDEQMPANWPCADARALGLNEGENDE